MAKRRVGLFLRLPEPESIVMTFHGRVLLDGFVLSRICLSDSSTSVSVKDPLVLRFSGN
jgi:hypothetical protein